MKLGTLAAAQLVKALPRTRISRAVGRLSELHLPPSLSRGLVGLYTKAFDVDLADAEPPARGGLAYPSFEAFFTRRLRAGTRPFPVDPLVLASPADGRLDARGTVDADGVLSVKGEQYRVEELLASAQEARRYHGGDYVLIYLSPRDYHRVHSPATGRLCEVRSEPGDLFPVNRLGSHVPRLLVRNRRVSLVVDSPAFGRITVVMVAAMIVGRVSVSAIDAPDVPQGVHLFEPPVELASGDELGVFHLGSTVVLFTEPGACAEWAGATGTLRAGARLASATTRHRSAAGQEDPHHD